VNRGRQGGRPFPSIGFKIKPEKTVSYPGFEEGGETKAEAVAEAIGQHRKRKEKAEKRAKEGEPYEWYDEWRDGDEVEDEDVIFALIDEIDRLKAEIESLKTERTGGNA
jgi:surface antigen